MRTEGSEIRKKSHPLKLERRVSLHCFHVSVFLCLLFIRPFVFLLDEALHTKAGRVGTHSGSNGVEPTGAWL